MKAKFKLAAAAATILASAGAVSAQQTAYPAFAYGADISWYTQMQAEGANAVYDADGSATDAASLTALYGFDAIRLRLWVDPANHLADTGGFCGLDDVKEKALKATAQGQRVMIDFHYSDTWADAGNQLVPSAWSQAVTAAQMAAQVYSYTRQSLSELKEAGVNVAWVQIGNETSNGMLFDLGRLAIDNVTAAQRVDNFISFFNAGAKAAREIVPDAKTVCHLNNGYDTAMYQWFFGEIAKRPTALDNDYIGMSLYPIANQSWDASSADYCMTSAWRSRTDQALATMTALNTSTGRRFLVCETGFPNSWTLSAEGGAQASADAMEARCNADAADYMAYVTTAAQASGICDGIFYWEPECVGYHNYSMGAMNRDGRPNAVWDYVKAHSSFTGIGQVTADGQASPVIAIVDGQVRVDGTACPGARVTSLDGREAIPATAGVYIVSVPGLKPVKISVR